MLGIWTLQSQAETDAFCQLHYQESGEQLDPKAVKLYVSDECPYEGYSLTRLELAPQILTRTAGRQTIPGRSVSYALLRTSHVDRGYPIIPLTLTSQNIYDINGILRFRVTPDNLRRYMTFYGHIVTSPPFYFFTRLSQLAPLLQNLPPTEQSRIQTAIAGVFKVDGKGELQIPIDKADYFLLGNTFTFQMPCFHDGALFITKVKISADGIPEMLQDSPLQVEGLFDDERNLNYYPLDSGRTLGEALRAYGRKAQRAHLLSLRTLQFDTILQAWLLPLFVFHLFVLFALGMSGSQVFDYFERLKASSLLTWGAAAIGAIGTAIGLFRYVFLEAMNYVRPLVPSVWAHIAASLEGEARKMSTALGYPMFFLLNALEHGLKILMSTSLLVNGVSLLIQPAIPALNFGQAVTFVLSRMPLVGGRIGRYLQPTPFAPVVFPEPAAAIAGAFVWFFFAMVFVRLLGRILSAAGKRE